MKKALLLIFLFVISSGCSNIHRAQRDLQGADRIVSGVSDEIDRVTMRDAVCLCGDQNSSYDRNCACMVHRGSFVSDDYIHGVVIYIALDNDMVIYGPVVFSRIVFNNCLSRESIITEHSLDGNRYRISGSDRMCEQFYIVTSDGRRTRSFTMDFADPPDPPPDPENHQTPMLDRQGPA